jgi:2-amino-4-hydroxy-6-hydroxymethyldihydropteridine diphosphokinase
MEILIGLGGNLGDPLATFRVIRQTLSRDLRLRASSRLYRTRAVGPPQPDYCNAVMYFATGWDPLELLDRCLALELRAGRDRGRVPRWSPRTLDIDLLMARGVVHRGPRLELPHPRFAERVFALRPAAELAPDWRHPLVGDSLAELAERASILDPGAILEILGEW